MNKHDEDLRTNYQHLEVLYSDFDKRFKDNLEMDIPAEWAIDPFLNTETINIDVITNEELKLKINRGYQEFWLQKKICILYHGFWAVI